MKRVTYSEELRWNSWTSFSSVQFPSFISSWLYYQAKKNLTHDWRMKSCQIRSDEELKAEKCYLYILYIRRGMHWYDVVSRGFWVWWGGFRPAMKGKRSAELFQAGRGPCLPLERTGGENWRNFKKNSAILCPHLFSYRFCLLQLEHECSRNIAQYCIWSTWKIQVA